MCQEIDKSVIRGLYWTLVKMILIWNKELGFRSGSFCVGLSRGRASLGFPHGFTESLGCNEALFLCCRFYGVCPGLRSAIDRTERSTGSLVPAANRVKEFKNS